MENLNALFTEGANLEKNDTPRNFELWVTKKSKEITQSNIAKYEKYVCDNTYPLENRYVCFFALFTYYRKNGYIHDMGKIVYSFEPEFKNFYLFDHIKHMSRIKVATISQYDELIMHGATLLKKYHDFVGFLNQHVELCARYYELHLDMRKVELPDGTTDYTDLLKQALEAANVCCEQDSSYAKLRVNRGRILALMGDYDQAEKEIMDGIALVPEDSYHAQTVSSFENYYENITSIAAYDNATNEIRKVQKTVSTAEKDIKNMRVENLRNVSIVTAAFALLLSGIEAFAKIQDFHVIGRVIMMYAGLFMFAIGFICIVASLYSAPFKEKKASNVISIAFSLFGLALFMTMFLI